jgi:hypothetical protein
MLLKRSYPLRNFVDVSGVICKPFRAYLGRLWQDAPVNLANRGHSFLTHKA